MRVPMGVLAVTLSAGLSQIAIADETPREPKVLEIKAQGEKARKQYCYSTFKIDEKGNWSAETMFSNGKNIDGDNFQAILTIKDHKGGNCLALNQVRGVRSAAFCKGSCERTVNHSGTTVVTSHDLTNNYTYQCTGWDSKDDLLAATGAAVRIACTAAGGGWACATPYPGGELPDTGEKPKKTNVGCAQ